MQDQEGLEAGWNGSGGARYAIIDSDSYLLKAQAVDSTRDSRFSTIYKNDHPWLERRLRNGLRNRETRRMWRARRLRNCCACWRWSS